MHDSGLLQSKEGSNVCQRITVPSDTYVSIYDQVHIAEQEFCILRELFSVRVPTPGFGQRGPGFRRDQVMSYYRVFMPGYQSFPKHLLFWLVLVAGLLAFCVQSGETGSADTAHRLQ